MTIIDSQVHAYEANTPAALANVPNWPPHVTGERWWRRWTKWASTARSSSPPFRSTTMTRLAVEVQKARPDRMAIVKPVDPDDPAVDDVVADGRRRRARSASASS